MNKKNSGKQYKIKVGENILYWRKLKGLKQEDLAERIGISKTALSNIENGISKPDIERLEDIADALVIEVSQLLYNPQQMVVYNSDLQTKKIMSDSGISGTVDNALLQRLTTIMEKITMLFSVDRK